MGEMDRQMHVSHMVVTFRAAFSCLVVTASPTEWRTHCEGSLPSQLSQGTVAVPTVLQDFRPQSHGAVRTTWTVAGVAPGHLWHDEGGVPLGVHTHLAL